MWNMHTLLCLISSKNIDVFFFFYLAQMYLQGHAFGPQTNCWNMIYLIMVTRVQLSGIVSYLVQMIPDTDIPIAGAIQTGNFLYITSSDPSGEI